MEILWKYRNSGDQRQGAGGKFMYKSSCIVKIQNSGINTGVMGKFMCKSSCIVKIHEQWDYHQGSGEVQIFERKMTKDICKSRSTLNRGD